LDDFIYLLSIFTYNNLNSSYYFPTLPKYFSFVSIREKYHLVYEKRMDEKRLNMKMVLPEDYDLEAQMEFFKEKIKEKYNTVTELF
jgi:hypothetical protein